MDPSVRADRGVLARRRSRVGWPTGCEGFAEVIDLWYRGGDWANQWLSMRHVLGIFADLGAHRAAAVLHGALVAAGAAAALPFEPGDAEQLAAEADRARDVLGPAEFAAAVRSGAAMSDADTVAYVQSEIERLLDDSDRRRSTRAPVVDVVAS